MNSWLQPTRIAASLVAVMVLAVVGCADTGVVEDAAQSFVAPATWTLDEAETLNGFDTISRRLIYSSTGSRSDACAQAAQALADWAEVDVSDLNASQLDERNNRGCTFSTGSDHQFQQDGLSASMQVDPLRIDGVPIEDPNQPGGVGQIRFSVTKPKPS